MSAIRQLSNVMAGVPALVPPGGGSGKAGTFSGGARSVHRNPGTAGHLKTRTSANTTVVSDP